MKFSVESLANYVNGVVEGNHLEEIYGLSEYHNGTKGTLTYAVDKEKFEVALKTEVSAIVVPYDFYSSEKTLIKVENPKFAIAKIAELFNPYTVLPMTGISDKACIGENVKIGKDVIIMPFVFIENDVEIDDKSVIYPNVYIGKGCKIGKNVKIMANVSIYPGTIIGNNVIIHAGAVIGSDGFGYVEHKGVHNKIPHIGRVIVEDNVEIGANTCIDRGFIGDTVISKGTKIDNLVQIAHNVKIGENGIIVSQAGIAGSTVIGNNVIIAGQAGIVDHAVIGNNVIIMAQAGVDSKKVDDNKILLGSPARDALEQKRIFVAETKLPELLKRVKELEEKIEKLSEHR